MVGQALIEILQVTNQGGFMMFVEVEVGHGDDRRRIEVRPPQLGHIQDLDLVAGDRLWIGVVAEGLEVPSQKLVFEFQ